MVDPAPRNLEITRTYHELTVALAALFGRKNVSWCAYATWASNTAGRFIRGEELPRLVREYLAKADHVKAGVDALNDRLSAVHDRAHVDESAIVRTLEDSVKGVTSNVGRGNLIVFAELAPPFARMLDAWKDSKTYDQEELDQFVAQLRPGRAEADGEGGKDYLKTAWEHYYKALFETDAHRKAQYIFMGNALCGYQEQIRLQGPIAGSLNAPIKDVFIDLLGVHASSAAPEKHHGLIRSLVERIARPVAEKVEQEWQEIATRRLMTLTLPDINLDLGKDVPPLAGGESFPGDLATLDYPPLVALMDKLDRTPNSLRGSAAGNWVELGDRMNYVVDFFRSRQQDARLYESPFAAG
jgi:hypothetical protein